MQNLIFAHQQDNLDRVVSTVAKEDMVIIISPEMIRNIGGIISCVTLGKSLNLSVPHFS